MKYTPIITVAVISALTLVVSTTCFADFKSPHAGSRDQNKSGDIQVSYDRDHGKKFTPGFDLSFQVSDKEYPRLRLNGLYFIDANLDKKRGRLAVVQNNGLNLVYGRYALTNGTWQLEQSVTLVEYNVAFQLNCIALELADFNTVRACFIKEGERSSRLGDLYKGVEKPGDNVFFIRVAEDGKVFINDKERKSVQWHPDLKSGDSPTGTNAPPEQKK